MNFLYSLVHFILFFDDVKLILSRPKKIGNTTTDLARKVYGLL